MTEELGYLPLETRAIELVQDTSTASYPKPVPPLAQPAPTSEPSNAISDPDALIAPSAVAEPATSSKPTEEVAAAPIGAASQTLATPVVAASTPAGVLATDASGPASGTAVNSIGANVTEKVALTVPNQIKVPASRQWMFATTHKSPSVYAPDLPTEFRWKAENGQYEVYLGAGAMYAAFTKLSRQSVGHIGANGLQPQTFTATQRDGTKTVSYFDHPENKVVFGLPGRPARALMRGSQDEMSAAIQLGSMLAGEPDRYKVGDQIVMHVVQRSDAQVWIFKVESDGKLDLPNQSLRAIKLTRAPRALNDTQVSVWLAPEQQYMPVRLRIDYSAERYDDMLWRGF